MQFIRRDLVPHKLIHDDLGDMRVYHDASRDAELTDSIIAIGIRDPITLRPHPKKEGEFQLVDGRRRQRCNEAAGNLEIPAEIYQMTDIEALLTALAKNIQRDEPDPVGLGFWLEEIKKKDPDIRTQEDLAKTVHKSQTWISRMLSAYNQALSSMKKEQVRLDKDVLSIEDLQNSMPTERHARAIRQASEEAKERIIDMTSIMGEPPSARSIERMVKAKSTPQAVLEKYDPKSELFDDGFITYQLVEDAGLTSTEAAKIVNDWRLYKLPWQQRRAKPLIELDIKPGDKYVEMYRKLSEVYPTELIDLVESVVPAKTFDTMARYCRRLIRSLVLKTSDELKQTILEDFRGP